MRLTAQQGKAGNHCTKKNRHIRPYTSAREREREHRAGTSQAAHPLRLAVLPADGGGDDVAGHRVAALLPLLHHQKKKQPALATEEQRRADRLRSGAGTRSGGKSCGFYLLRDGGGERGRSVQHHGLWPRRRLHGAAVYVRAEAGEVAPENA
jgi:hypothetical protein